MAKLAEFLENLDSNIQNANALAARVLSDESLESKSEFLSELVISSVEFQKQKGDIESEIAKFQKQNRFFSSDPANNTLKITSNGTLRLFTPITKKGLATLKYITHGSNSFKAVYIDNGLGRDIETIPSGGSVPNRGSGALVSGVPSDYELGEDEFMLQGTSNGHYNNSSYYYLSYTFEISGNPTMAAWSYNGGYVCTIANIPAIMVGFAVSECGHGGYNAAAVYNIGGESLKASGKAGDYNHYYYFARANKRDDIAHLQEKGAKIADTYTLLAEKTQEISAEIAEILKGIESKYNEAKNKADAAQTATAQSRAELERINAEIKKLNEQIATLPSNDELDSINAELALKEQELNKLNTQIQEQEAQKAQKEQEIEQIQENIAQIAEQNATLSDEINTLNSQKNELESQFNSINIDTTRRDELEAQKQALSAQIESKLQEQSAVNSEISRLNSEISLKENELNAIQNGDTNALQTRLNELEKQIQEAHAQKEQKEALKEQKEQELRELLAQNESGAELDSINAEIEKLKNQIALKTQKEQELDKLKQELENGSQNPNGADSSDSQSGTSSEQKQEQDTEPKPQSPSGDNSQSSTNPSHSEPPSSHSERSEESQSGAIISKDLIYLSFFKA